tara:strand:+ start:161 stop:622 length:462 start_codon:yes stop_codon:yes gene_type:complete
MDIESTIPNFQAVIALSFIGSYYSKNLFSGILVPIYIMFLSDIMLGFHQMLFWTYTPYIFVAIIGSIVPSNFNKLYMLLGGISSSLVFFFISNFGVWTLGGYGFTFSGLLSCYIAALPFLSNSIFSTLLFSALFIYLHRPFYSIYYNRYAFAR